MNFTNLHETDLKIALPDGKQIHGYMRGSLTDSSPVCIMMHGRPGYPNEIQQYLGARYLGERGITTLRLAMYDYGVNYRNQIDCTLDTHIADFDHVVEYLRRQNVEKLYALGHSYGGLTLAGSKSQLDAAIFWDPSHGLAFTDPEFKDDGSYPTEDYKDIIIGTGGPGFIGSIKQRDYDKAIGDNSDWVAGKNYPMLFITAAAGPLAKYGKMYFDAANCEKSIVAMPDAHHQFIDSDAVLEHLFDQTALWINGIEVHAT